MQLPIFCTKMWKPHPKRKAADSQTLRDCRKQAICCVAGGSDYTHTPSPPAPCILPVLPNRKIWVYVCSFKSHSVQTPCFADRSGNPAISQTQNLCSSTRPLRLRVKKARHRQYKLFRTRDSWRCCGPPARHTFPREFRIGEDAPASGRREFDQAWPSTGPEERDLSSGKPSK